MSEAQRRTQQMAVERALDLVENSTLSAEDFERMIPGEALGPAVVADAAVEAFRERIARWQPPCPLHDSGITMEHYEGYLRLCRLVASFSDVLAQLVKMCERQLGPSLDDGQR
jgi:hypothetical protein